jgi:hypothetical protein
MMNPASTTSSPTWLLVIVSQRTNSATARMRIWRALFGRTGDWVQYNLALSLARKTLTGLTQQEINRMLHKLRREYDAVGAADYFPNEANRQSRL